MSRVASLLRCGLVVATASNCGPTDERCRADSIDPSSMRCLAALTFAARDTAEMIPLQQEVDRYYDRWTRLGEAEPLVADRIPQRYRGAPSATIFTRNPRVIASWSDRVLETGDSEFDAVIGSLSNPQLYGIGRYFGDGEYYFTLETGSLYNEELLNTLLLPTSSRLTDPVQHNRDDGWWRWIDQPPGSSGTDDGTAEIEFAFGFGDCFPGCALHRIRAVVPATDEVTVYNLGGAPLPEGIELSPSTIPLP